MKISNSRADRYVAPVVDVVEVIVEAGFAVTASSQPTPSSGNIQQWGSDSWK